MSYFASCERTQTTVAISALLVAVTALVSSIYQASLSRQHQRLSVRPELSFSLMLTGGETAGVHLTNVGFGPARITKSAVYHLDEYLGPWNGATMDEAYSRANLSRDIFYRVWYPLIGADFDDFVFWIKPFQFQAHDDFVKLLDEIDIRLTYHSLYGEEIDTVTLRG